MRLTPVQLYTVNYHGAAALDESVVVWSESAWDAARSFVATFPSDGAKVVHVMHPEGDENFRIDPDPVPAPSGEWVPGAPPVNDNHYLVRVTSYPGFPFDVVTKRKDCEGTRPYESGANYYNAEDITHHNPNPIALETP